MKTCIKCGGNAYRDADTYCAHDFGEAPEPTNVMRYYAPEHREMLWWAQDKGCPGASHPTRDGAIAAWKDRWRWGHALVALFRWLHEPPAREARFTMDASPLYVDETGDFDESTLKKVREAIECLDPARARWSWASTLRASDVYTLARRSDDGAEFVAALPREIVGVTTSDPADDGTVMVQLHAPNAAITAAERGALIGRAMTEARRRLGAPPREGDHG